MFELGEWELSFYEIEGSKIYIIDNFYHDPDIVYDYCTKPLPDPWKHNPHLGYNMDKYEDRRLIENHDGLKDNYYKLSEICGQPPEDDLKFVTNVTKFIDRAYNDFDNKYWWPHRDLGYNAIVYFDDCSGTNLYKQDTPNPFLPEWVCPWVFKRDWEVIHTTEAKHNRCVLFDGKKFPHSMSITDDRMFDNYRVNQVYFFYEQPS